MVWRIVGSLLVLGSVGPVADATPTPATWMREIFLGTNDSSYFTYLLERDYPATYYAYTDSWLLLRYSLTTGEIQETHLLRRTRHVDEAADGRWKTLEEAVEPFSTEAHLRKERVDPAFPADRYAAERAWGGYALEITPHGIVLSSGKDEVVLIGEDALRKRLGDLDDLVIVERFHEKGHRFLVVRNGSACSDLDYREVVYKIDEARVQKAVETLKDRAGMPRPSPEDRASPPIAVPSHGTFVVREGDTLVQIARQVYGEASLYERILEANPEVEPTRLQIGQVLKIPAIEGREAKAPIGGAGEPAVERRNPASLPPPPVTLEEVRAYLEPEDRDLDLVPLWRKLGILAGGTSGGVEAALPLGYEEGADSFVLEKGRWTVSLFPPDSDTHAQRATPFRLLRISPRLAWEREFLVFEGADEPKGGKRTYVYRGNIELGAQRYDYEADPEFNRFGKSSPVFSIQPMAVSGTGILAFNMDFYRVVQGRVKRVLSVLKSGHMTSWGTRTLKEYDMVLRPGPVPGKSGAISIAYTVKYSADMLENSTSLFTVQGTAGFVWDSRAQEYRVDPDTTRGPKELFTRIDHLEREQFHDLYAEQMEKLATDGTQKQKAWVQEIHDQIRQAKERKRVR